jgi:leucyl aminopeptidase
MLNIDMTGYNPDKANTIALITNSASSSLNEFAGKVITEYCKNKFVKKSMFGGSSDHASWTRAGYHAIFPFEYKSNPYIHSSKDTVDRLDLKNAIEYVKLSVGFVIELSSF